MLKLNIFTVTSVIGTIISSIIIAGNGVQIYHMIKTDLEISHKISLTCVAYGRAYITLCTLILFCGYLALYGSLMVIT